MKEIDRIAALLGSDAMEKQVAAAIILGELEVGTPAVLTGLGKLLGAENAVLQRHALDALARMGPGKLLPEVLRRVTHADAEVRRAAAAALSAAGKDAVALIKERLATAPPDEKRALEGVLARMGGGDAFSALLRSLVEDNPEAARQAALAVREQVRAADARSRRAYLAETERFLAMKKTQESPSAMAAALKILGFIEDDKALPTLLTWLKKAGAPAEIRQEAIIAVRFALKDPDKARGTLDALLEIAEGGDRMLARTATDTLLGLKLPAAMAGRLARLAGAADGDRAKVAMEQLGQQDGKEATKALVELVATAPRARAEGAITALQGHEGAAGMLARALLKATDADRAWLIRKAVKQCGGGRLDKRLRDELLETAFERITAGEPGWEALLEVARDADPETTAEALRELAARLKKAKKEDRALAAFRVLCRSEHATDDDRYLLASLELGRSKLDTHPLSRARDEALGLVQQLLARRYDVGAALRKDRSISLEHKFYLGFHFIEKGEPLGEELLTEVVEKSGRTKMGKTAKNKLKLAEQ